MSRIINIKQINWIFLLVIISVMIQPSLSKSNDALPLLPTDTEKSSGNLNLGSLVQDNQKLSEPQEENKNKLELLEVKADEIPEDVEVFVSEYPVDAKIDGEIMDTARNIVFRPIFRYKNKQQALRPTSGGINRRYYIPKRYYKPTYYPYYYGQKYYYY